MKNLLLFALSFICVSVAYAQVEIEINPIPSYGSAILDDPSTLPIDVKAKAKITNTSNETKTFLWIKNVLEKPDIWGIAVCDVNGCYSILADTIDFTLPAGATEILDVHAYPSGDPMTLEGAVAGNAHVMVQVVEIGNEENTMTGEYFLNLDATTSLVNIEELKKIQLYPNPTSNYFELEGSESVDFLKVVDLQGRTLAQFNAGQANQKYDISSLIEGIYQVVLFDEDGQLMKTLRLKKQ